MGLNEKRLSVAVVIPHFKQTLNNSELFSLQAWKKYLSKYDTYVISPPMIKPPDRRIKVKNFAATNFTSVKSYSRLLLTREFYQTFNKYEYILIYQLDALVFSDQLPVWCKQNLSYIGAPWFHSLIGLLSTHSLKLRGGNGGLSLRRIPDFLRVLEKTDASNYPFNEDGFWSFEAPKLDPRFKTAAFKQSIAFAFEENPRKCFRLNGGKLPFGAHAWQKYDKELWLQKLPLLSH